MHFLEKKNCKFVGQTTYLVKVDSREVLTIFRVGDGRRQMQLRCFTWLHWLVVCHRSGLKLFSSLQTVAPILRLDWQVYSTKFLRSPEPRFCNFLPKHFLYSLEVYFSQQFEFGVCPHFSNIYFKKIEWKWCSFFTIDKYFLKKSVSTHSIFFIVKHITNEFPVWLDNSFNLKN